jgi:CDP-diacylglycerol--glycerol-3-phosphate 3-phosphatidyltransferase
LENPVNSSQPTTFTDILRKAFAKILIAIGKFFNRLGIHPNTMTLFGLAGSIAAAYLLARGQIVWGGVVVLLMAPMDAIDGAMARQGGKVTRFGGFLDSVVDRYFEFFILGGLLIYYTNLGESLPIILVYLAAVGSSMVSYTRARGEAAGYPVKGGLLTRVERFLILIPCLLINRPLIALWILAVLTNFTAIQRVFLVRVKAKAGHDII